VNYVDFINQRIKAAAAAHKRVIVYGQNVSTGSSLSGLSRGFDKLANCTVINTSNAEGTLVGMGFGLMLRGVPAIFFMKQLDFLLLGMEQLTDTWNTFRHRDLTASFTIVPIIVDTGWEGPQSCLNNLSDFSSMSRVPGFTITNRADAETVIDRQVFAPGVRIVGVSQRLFRTPIIECGEPRFFGQDRGVAQYAKGDAATIVAFNLAFPQAKTLHDELSKREQAASLFAVSATIPDDVSAIIADAERTGCLIVVDDSKSVHAPSQALVAQMRGGNSRLQVVEVKRSWSLDAAAPNADQLAFDSTAVADRLGLSV
jgi:pyruvate dehydrogenase E1 component beta subunit